MNVEAPLPIPSSGPVSLEEERAVVARLKKGDRSALAPLFGWFGDRLYRFIILPRLANTEQAEDVLKETFRITMERIDQYEPGPSSIFAWLRRIAINLCIDSGRRQTREIRILKNVAAEPDVLPHLPPPDRSTVLRELREQIECSLTRLNPRYAHALRLRLLEDRSRQECAEALGVTIPQFDVVLHRACAAFRGAYPP